MKFKAKKKKKAAPTTPKHPDWLKGVILGMSDETLLQAAMFCIMQSDISIDIADERTADFMTIKASDLAPLIALEQRNRMLRALLVLEPAQRLEAVQQADSDALFGLIICFDTALNPRFPLPDADPDTLRSLLLVAKLRAISLPDAEAIQMATATSLAAWEEFVVLG